MPRLLLALAVLAGSVVFAQADAGTRPRPTVAVLYFDVPEKPEELAVFKKGLAQMLITDLVADERLQVVERARLEEVLTELRLSASSHVDPASAQRMGKLLGARYQVMGSIVPMPKGTLFFETRLVEVETGKTVRAVRATAQPDDVFDAEQKTAKALVEQIVAADALAPRAQTASPKAPKKLKYASAVKYAKALDAGDHQDPATKRALLAEVVKEEPDFILARVDLLNLTQ